MSETLARPALSGDTRQCACGGWTRFVVCQYCGTTDPAVTAAGWVSSSPLTVPTAFDPVAVPPPAVSAPPVVPAPLVAQHDAPMMAAATSAFADLHAAAPAASMSAPAAAPASMAPPVAYPAPAAPQSLSGPYAPADSPLPAPVFAAPPAPDALAGFSPAGDPGASLIGAGAPGTYPAPLPVPPGAAWPQGEAPSAPAPMTFAPEALDIAEAATVGGAAKVKGARPRWVAPAAGVAVVAAAAAAYFVWFGGSSSNNNDAIAPPVHHAAVLTPALLTSTLPAGFTAEGAPVTQPVTAISPLQAPGHPITGATAAESLDAKNVKGSELSALALKFPTPAAASAWAALKTPQPKGQVVAYSSRGVFAFGVETDSPKDAAASAAVAAWAKSLGG